MNGDGLKANIRCSCLVKSLNPLGVNASEVVWKSGNSELVRCFYDFRVYNGYSSGFKAYLHLIKNNKSDQTAQFRFMQVDGPYTDDLNTPFKERYV